MDNFSFDRIGEFFSRMDSAESTYFLLCALIAFLFGFIIAYLIRTARIGRLKKSLRESEKRYQDLEVELNTAKGKAKEATEAWELAEREKVDLLDRTQRLEADKRQLTNEALRLNSEIEALNQSNRNYAADINALNDRIQELENQPADSSPATGTQQIAASTPPAEGPEVVTASAGVSIQTEERFAAFEERLAQLERENQRLEEKLETLNAGPYPDDAETDRSAAEPTTVAALVDNNEPQVKINPDKSVMGERIVTEDREADDLTRIEHIGTFVQSQLNQIGVFTYEDIASWDPARIAQVTSLIGYLPGRIEKDNWVGQAAALAAAKADGGDTQSRGFAAASANVDEEDLKIVEGIGPKIERVLKDSGIFTLRHLAERDPEEIRSMLIQAGDTYRTHSPDTWPKQARLAVDGEMDELAAYQQELKGGREV